MAMQLSEVVHPARIPDVDVRPVSVYIYKQAATVLANSILKKAFKKHLRHMKNPSKICQKTFQNMKNAENFQKHY